MNTQTFPELVYFKTDTKYVVTYRGQTKEFPFMGSSLIAWQELEKWVEQLDEQYFEQLALLDNKQGWEHLYINGAMPSAPYPTIFAQQIDGWIKGYKKAVQHHKTQIEARDVIFLVSSDGHRINLNLRAYATSQYEILKIVTNLELELFERIVIPESVSFDWQAEKLYLKTKHQSNENDIQAGEYSIFKIEKTK